MQIIKNFISLWGGRESKVEQEFEDVSPEFDCTNLLVSNANFDWAEFFEPEIFHVWVEELKNAVKRKDPDLWSLTGKAILIQSTNESEVCNLLQKIVVEAQMKFAYVPARQVMSLLPNIRQKFKQISPGIVMLESGSWIKDDDAEFGMPPLSQDDSSGIGLLAKDLKNFDCELPIVFVTCVKSYEDVSKKLLKVDAFDRIFAVEKPSAEFIGKRFIKLFDKISLDDSLTCAEKKIGLLLQSEYESQSEQELLALRLKRLAKHESRPINFNDLTDFALRGLQEQNRLKPIKVDSETRRKTAYHEAGHACISVIASNGENIPDYASIVPSKNFEGVIFESLSFYDNLDEVTYKFLLLKTRIALAGRAAEELFFGGLNISSGANSDLSSATRLCFRLFAYSGFHPKMDGQTISASNLAVLNLGDVDPVQYERVSKDVRNFLEEQYLFVMNTLEENKAFVEAVAQRLLWDPVVDQQEMKMLSEQHGILIPSN